MRTLPALILGTAFLTAFAPELYGQPQTLLSQDFENGLGGWTVVGGPVPSPWHVAPSGECGAITAMAACNNGPFSCNYQLSGVPPVTVVSLRSPQFYLHGKGPWTFAFDHLKATDAGGEIASIWLEETSDGIFAPVKNGVADTSVLKHEAFTVSLDDWWQGKAVILDFSLKIDSVGNQGFGWLIDNIVVTNESGWIEFDEAAKPGSLGPPLLSGFGTLSASSNNQIDLTNTIPNTTAWLIAGVSLNGSPFLGGALFPDPLIVIPLSTGPNGNVHLPFALPPVVEPRMKFYIQFWIQDPGASLGLSASNGLKGITS